MWSSTGYLNGWERGSWVTCGRGKKDEMIIVTVDQVLVHLSIMVGETM